MNKYFTIVNFFPVMYLFMLLFVFMSYQSQSINEMTEIYVRDCADAANDAAMLEARATANIDMYGQVTLNPEAIWHTYKYVFLRGLDLYSDKNMELLEAYCPATIIAVNDGYFVRMRTLDYAHPSGVPQPVYKFSQKIPFAREWNGTIIADTMNGSHIYGYSPLNGAVIFGNDTPVANSRDGSTPHDMSQIAFELVKAMDYFIEIENGSEGVWGAKKFYLPKDLVDSVAYDAVTFKGLAIITLVQGFDMKGTKPLDIYTITNTQLVQAKYFGCYTRGGVKYYSPLVDYNFLTSANTAEQIVTTKQQAAKLGYFPDPSYYQIPY